MFIRMLLYYFVDNEQYFNRDHLYGYFDDGERFAFFNQAVLESISTSFFFTLMLSIVMTGIRG